ncbi:MAG TPA: hypothetical protein VGG28_34900 [Kofleriaceae bacterium]
MIAAIACIDPYHPRGDERFRQKNRGRKRGRNLGFATSAKSNLFDFAVNPAVPQRARRSCERGRMRMMAAIVMVLVLGPTAYAGRGGGRGTGSSSHSHSVRSYTRKNGTHVAAHRQTDPNHTQLDNYSTKGNVNPSTGTSGTRSAAH